MTCMKSLYYLYVEKAPRIITVPIAAGIFIHRGCERFNDPNKERPKFKSAESYAGRRVGSWKRFVASKGEYTGKKLRESFDGELWAVAETTVRPCSVNFYEMFSERKRPVESERRFRVGLGDFIFSGVFDVIDRPFKFMDYKTGKWGPDNIKLQNDNQFTLYAAVLPMLAAHDDSLRDRLKLTRAQKRTLRKNPVELMPEVTGEYIDLRNGEVYEMWRDEHDLIELLNSVEAQAIRAEHGDFSHSKMHHCEKCLVRDKCLEDGLEGRVLLREDAIEASGGMWLFPPRGELKVYTEVPGNIRVLGSSKKRKKKEKEGDYPLFKVVS